MFRQKIVIFSGKARHGKDTAADHMVKELTEAGYSAIKIAYADYLKFVCKQYFGWNGEKDDIGRTILQTVGTDRTRRTNKDYWVDHVIGLSKTIFKTVDYIIISDARFINEMDKWYEYEEKSNRRLSIKTVRIERVEMGGLPFDNGLTDKQKAHPSECELDSYFFDYKLTAASVESLKEMVSQLKFELM